MRWSSRLAECLDSSARSTLAGRSLAACAGPSPFPVSASCAPSGTSTASSTSGWRRPPCSSGPARRSTTAAAPASTPAWRSPTATRTAPPTPSAPFPAPARSSSPPARTSTDAEPPRPPGPQARVARYAWVDHYAPLRIGLRAMAHRLRAAGQRAVAFADDNSIVDREVAHLAGLGWFGKNANLLLPGAGSWFVLGCVVTTRRAARRPSPSPTDAGRAGAASTPARPAPSSPPA